MASKPNFYYIVYDILVGIFLSGWKSNPNNAKRPSLTILWQIFENPSKIGCSKRQVFNSLKDICGIKFLKWRKNYYQKPVRRF